MLHLIDEGMPFQAARDEFVKLLGPAHVLQDEASLRFYSSDVFFWEDVVLAEAVLQPADAAQASGVLKIAATHQLFIAPRGGGVSYTKGYTPQHAGTVILDLSRLCDIKELNSIDRYVTVGAGCTWQQLSAALKGTGLRPAVKGPISGTHATVGGIAAQNAGSANMAGFLSLEVLLADGTIVRTGSAGLNSKPSPFYRSYGPDLTGLFLGDTGALAIKTACTLALEPEPLGAAFASLAFETLGAMTNVMIGLARAPIACKTLGLDPLKNRTATKVGAAEGLQTLANVVSSAGSVVSGLKQAVQIASAGQNLLDDVRWSLHVTVEGHDQVAADYALATLRPIWTGHAREIEPSVPIAMRARPFSIRGIVGLNGERWVPVHGLFPLSRAPEVVQQTEAFFEQRAKQLAAHGITHSFLVTTAANHWLIEPMFYWPDALGPLHAHVLGDKFDKFKNFPANPAARVVVHQTRQDLADLFQSLGAVHSQLGKFYDFAGSLDPKTYEVLTAIKDALDPARRLNPGNLGWA